MAITAKVRVNNVSVNGDETRLTFYADYADERNKEWAKYTPSLVLEMTVKNAVADNFAPGQAFTLTFTPE